MDETLYTVEEAAQHLKTTARTVRDWLKAGKLRGLRVGQQWRISESAIDAFLHPPLSPVAPDDPLSPINEAIVQEGACTRNAEKDQAQRDNQGRPNIPPHAMDEA